SHNSGAYNGFKIKLPPGVSAPSSFTQVVEKNIPKDAPVAVPARLPRIDWLPFYLKTLKSKVNLAVIKKAGLEVVVDPMHGVGERHFENLVNGGRTKVRT